MTNQEFEKGISIIDDKIQKDIRDALFDLWRQHDNWGNFDEGDLLEIYIAMVNIFKKYSGDRLE